MKRRQKYQEQEKIIGHGSLATGKVEHPFGVGAMTGYVPSWDWS